MKLDVVVQRVRVKLDSGWRVMATDLGTIKGVVPWMVREGDRLRVSGEWKPSRLAGMPPEFDFREALPLVETDPRALLEWACEVTKGLGPSKAEVIWEAYGQNWSDDPDLLWVNGLSRATREAWAETLERLAEQRAQAEAVAWLLAKGCTMKLAMAAWGTWTEQTIPVVQADPYALAGLPHYSFADIDGAIRLACGVEDGDPRRLEAALLYALARATAGGDTAAERQAVTMQALAMVASGRFDVEEAGEAWGRLQDRCEVRMINGHVCGKTDFDAETTIAEAFGLGTTPKE